MAGRLLVAALASMAAAEADQIAEFYKDKQLQIIVRSSPGGSDDQYSRLVAARAFDRTMKDSAFLADSERIKAEISPTSGEEMQRLVADIVDAPANVRARAKQAMKLRPDDGQAAKGRARDPQ
jgi:hypothetical protein